ncbi:MAG: hypothetical protein OEX04_05210 [Acidimicrobiia bacterium]|nr:hypothetical protein [Acidimicrobiia bacterium]MDH4306857.1 hypothetical protein [Acidimicrobiia bacterium]MDH5293214.1 hypothetical protein [Acidimicrobiia bacterium]
MTRFLITGGEQRGKRSLAAGNKRWYRYGKAHLVEVDTAVKTASTRLSYTSPSGVTAAEDPAILFKQGYIDGDRLLLTTQTEVLVLSYPNLERIGYVSLPSFNDVHHVRPTPDGTLLVVNTGLDQLIEVGLDGELVRRWSVTGSDPWNGRFDPDEDYRLHASTKPYEAHPNHVFHIGDEPWVTRFEKRDAVSMVDPGRRIDIGAERVHDGTVAGDHVYFTTVDGRVAVACTDTLEVVEMIDLNTIDGNDAILGWCRGIHIEGDQAWIGFSRLRPTAFRENVSWVREGFKRSLGTHIAKYDLVNRRLLDRFDIEGQTPLNAVFSILPA